MDGWVIVGTKLDSKQLEKDLKNSERRLQQYEKEAEKLTKAKTKAEIDLQPYEEQKRLIKEATDDMLQYSQTSQEVTNNLNIEKAQLEELNQKYSKQLNNLEEINKKIKENEKNQELMKIQVEETKNKINGIDVDFNKIGKSTSNVIKKVGKWALAIFSVRSAYMLVRRAVSTLSQYNEDLANKIQSIQLILASALEPIINRLVNLVYKLLYYLNYITKAWFNIDLFSSANEKALNKGAKSAEKMKKSLAGFDEMNIMQDTSTGGAGGGGVSIPSMEDVEIPSWIKWIADNKDIVIAGLIGIAGAIGLIKLSELIGGLSELWKIIKPLFMFIGANAQIIGGIILIIGGLTIAIKGIIDYLKDPTWENFGKILLGIGIIAGGVLLIFGGFPALIALIVGAVVALGVAIYKNWDKIKEVLGVVQKWVYDHIIKPIGKFFSNLWDGILKGANLLWYGIKYGAISMVNFVISVINTMIKGILAPFNLLIDGLNLIPGVKIKKLKIEIPKIPLPKLKVGAIINQPGRGVPVGGNRAIGGEAGREGIIPLTDSQAMETLGATIGKYININLTNITKLDNRQIAKEQKKINAQNDFAFNR